MQNPSLTHASLRFATLSGANLEMADLTDADLSDARLDGANLSGAELADAVLERVDFAGARLGGANFSGANLKEARNLTQAQIDEALGDTLTILPPHLARPEGWGGGAGRTVSDLLGRNGRHQDTADGKAPRARGTTVSWLVGGPRTTLMTRAG
jgi:hypothetical protein